MRPLVVLLLIAVPLAGCLQADDGGEGPVGSPAARAATVPPLDWDLDAGIDWWEHFATNFPKHDSNTPTNALAREHIVAEMEALGFDVEVRAYNAAPRGVEVPEQLGLEYHAVVATLPGTDAIDADGIEHRIGLVSHYDTQTATIMGAYDDASGVAAEYNICKALAQVPMERTLACIFFDAEEQGLVASQKYVEDAVLEGDEGFVYDFVLGYDMTGINWPGHDWKMYVMTGGVDFVPVLVPFAAEIMHDVLGYPDAGVEVLDVHDRNSDERRFKEACIPILRFAGGRNAADYPAYHLPHDLVEYVYQYTGGRDNFAAGFQTIVEASYHTVLAMDGTSIAEMEAHYLGIRDAGPPDCAQ